MIVLDTHVLAWWACDDSELSGTAAQAVDETLGNSEDVIVSCISAWEIAVKTFTGGDRAALEERFFNAHRDLPQADTGAEHGPVSPGARRPPKACYIGSLVSVSV